MSSPSVRYTSWWRARLFSCANSCATMCAAKWVLSSDCTRTCAPGRPARISRATSSGFMGGILHGRAARAPIMKRMDLHPAAARTPNPTPDDEQLLASARRALAIEARAAEALTAGRGAAFAQACRVCLDCHGRVVVTGMGKSGHVAGKIAATLASTGTPAFFLHPAEAGHGDLRMITRVDAVLALSNSGETPELVLVLPPLKRLAVPLIVMTGKTDSTLGLAASVTLDVGVSEEACPLNLAPTASTTATPPMGDEIGKASGRER